MTLTTPTGAHIVTPERPKATDLDFADNPAVSSVLEKALSPVTSVDDSQASRVVNCDNIPWTPFPMPGTAYKLLNINETTGAATILLYVSEGAQAPLHRHLGGAEAYNIFGRWAYEGEDNDVIGPNCYIYEPAGITHLPKQESEALMFGIFHGPIVGYDERGNRAGVIDADVLYDLAAANNAVGHLPARANK